jgi:hypothetical protein
VCRRENLTQVHYIYGDELRQSAGQARRRAELHVLAMTLGEFQVYVVEVCRGCGWNHLVEQYLLGRAGLSTSNGSSHGSSNGSSNGGAEVATAGRAGRGGSRSPTRLHGGVAD